MVPSGGESASLAFLVFSGFNQRAVIAFLRVLERHRLPYGIVASGRDDSIFRTAFRHRVAHVRESLDLSVANIGAAISRVSEICSGYRLVLAPSTEAMNRFFLNNRHEFESQGVRIPLVDRQLYERISDKHPFGELCRRHGIPVPAELDDPRSSPLPFVAKPRTHDQSAGRRPVLVFTERDRDAFIQNSDLEAYYLQQYVPGRSLYLLLFVPEDGRVLRYSQENLVQQPGGGSIIAAVASDFHLTAESDRYVAMLKAVGFHGLVMIEVRQQGSDFYMIEANPRFWGPSQLFVDAMEENLFDAFLADLGVPGRPPSEVCGNRYFWYDGLLETLQHGGNPVFHNYTAERLAVDLPAWLDADLYRRGDTLETCSAASVESST